jgi:DNA polymerase III alpha subunit
MNIDVYGQTVLTEADLHDLYMQDPNRKIKRCYVESPINFNSELELSALPNLIEYELLTESVETFDRRLQSRWLMPEEYKKLDIAKYVLEICKTDEERQRVGQELLLYLDRDLFPLLQYMKYLVDTMRKHKLVWGVGRGSSVSSYVLFLIGVHRINSLYYQLDIGEFLR